MEERVTLEWYKFAKLTGLTGARTKFAKTACLYIQTNPQGCPIRIGKASKGLEARYRGGTGYAIDAAMHGSGNLLFAASVPQDLCGHIEDELIWPRVSHLQQPRQDFATVPAVGHHALWDTTKIGRFPDQP